MGRTLKRVALDFKWPLRQIWEGYWNPYSGARHDCKACGATGHSPEMKRLSDDWYAFDKPRFSGWCYHLEQDEVDALVAEGRLKLDFKHPPTAVEVNEWSKSGFGHDACNKWICLKVRAARLGVAGDCEFCAGKGERWFPVEWEKLADEWQNVEPPDGEGFQLWETTSEGSPISPVFESLEELCAWAAVNATTFGTSCFATKEEWLSMLQADFVCHKQGNMVFM